MSRRSSGSIRRKLTPLVDGMACLLVTWMLGCASPKCDHPADRTDTPELVIHLGSSLLSDSRYFFQQSEVYERGEIGYRQRGEPEIRCAPMSEYTKDALMSKLDRATLMMIERIAKERWDEKLHDSVMLTITVGELRASMPVDNVPDELHAMLALVDEIWSDQFGRSYYPLMRAIRQ